MRQTERNEGKFANAPRCDPCSMECRFRLSSHQPSCTPSIFATPARTFEFHIRKTPSTHRRPPCMTRSRALSRQRSLWAANQEARAPAGHVFLVSWRARHLNSVSSAIAKRPNTFSLNENAPSHRNRRGNTAYIPLRSLHACIVFIRATRDTAIRYVYVVKLC